MVISSACPSYDLWADVDAATTTKRTKKMTPRTAEPAKEDDVQTDLHPLRNVIAQANPSEQDSSSSDGIPISIAAHIQKTGSRIQGLTCKHAY